MNIQSIRTRFMFLYCHQEVSIPLQCEQTITNIIFYFEAREKGGLKKNNKYLSNG